MANHAFVKTRRWMKPEAITGLLEELNQKHLKGNLKIEHGPVTDTPDCRYYWLITYVSSVDGEIYAIRNMWLDTYRTFDMRHGGGADFAWWLDCLITNEVAIKFGGSLTDEGTGDEKLPVAPGKFDKLADSIAQMHAFAKPENLRYMLEFDIPNLVPPEFRDGLLDAVMAATQERKE